MEVTTISKTISFPSMSKDIPSAFPDLKLSETCIECKKKQLKKCPYMEKLNERNT